jgi:hypothetical protein
MAQIEPPSAWRGLLEARVPTGKSDNFFRTDTKCKIALFSPSRTQDLVTFPIVPHLEFSPEICTYG